MIERELFQPGVASHPSAQGTTDQSRWILVLQPEELWTCYALELFPFLNSWPLGHRHPYHHSLLLRVSKIDDVSICTIVGEKEYFVPVPTKHPTNYSIHRHWSSQWGCGIQIDIAQAIGTCSIPKIHHYPPIIRVWVSLNWEPRNQPCYILYLWQCTGIDPTKKSSQSRPYRHPKCWFIHGLGLLMYHNPLSLKQCQ